MGEQISVLWWNLDWQNLAKNAEQIEAVLALDPRPDVIGLSELSAHRSEAWREALMPAGYEFLPDSTELPRRQLRVLLGASIPFRAASDERFHVGRIQSLCSGLVQVGEATVEVHATHVPNGSANGWEKMDHLNAVRAGFEPPHSHPQVLMGDFNTPQDEVDGRIITFAQHPDGNIGKSGKTSRPYSPERPYDAELHDLAERAVLEGLPGQCEMPDAFRELHPDAREGTWAPKRTPERVRRFDHIYATRDLEPVSVRHMSEWREENLSDHSGVEATFELSAT